jgi:hypothetical protein
VLDDAHNTPSFRASRVLNPLNGRADPTLARVSLAGAPLPPPRIESVASVLLADRFSYKGVLGGCAGPSAGSWRGDAVLGPTWRRKG